MSTEEARFYNEYKKVVWCIKVDKKETRSTYVTGLAIGNGLLLAIAKSLVGEDIQFVALRDRIEHELASVWVEPTWNLALLKFKQKPKDFIPAKLATNGKLHALELCYFIGHFESRHALFTHATISHPCEENITLPDLSDPSSKCENFHYDFSMWINRPCVILGQIYNDKRQGLSEYEKQFEPMVPVFPYQGMDGDGPIFKTNGDVVGMKFSEFEGLHLAIHVSALVKFVEAGLKVDRLKSRIFSGI